MQRASAVAFAVVSLVGSSAFAHDKAACLGAYEAGQPQRAEGRLREARASFLICAADPCPAAMREECTRWLAEVDAAMPTVVVRAHEGTRDVADVRVLVDGRELTSRLDGTPLVVDPGERHFRFERGATAIDRTELVNAGEKLRAIDVDLPMPIAKARSTWPAYALLGVGTAAFASFAVFGITGLERYEQLKTSCAPACASSDSAAVQRRFFAADLSLGVSLLAFGGATWWLLARDPRSDETSATEVRVGPTKDGASLSVRGRF